MTLVRPELAAHERIAALQQQADLARLAWFPAVPPAGPKPKRKRAFGLRTSCDSRSARACPEFRSL
jgi:hypothetical protein